MNHKKISFSIEKIQRQYGNKEALRIAKQLGADAVDYALAGSGYYDYENPQSVYSKSDEEIIAHCEEIKRYAKEIGIEICQTHGRYEGFRNQEKEDELLVENMRRDLLATKALGAPVCVVHAVTTIHMGPDYPAKQMQDLNFDMFTRILPYARQYNVKVATETFGDAAEFDTCDFFGNIDEFIKSYNRICAVEDFKEYFTICADTGHSNKASRYNNNPLPADVIRMLGGNVTVLHLNDNDTLTDQHKMPLSGTIDWEDVLNALDEIGYQGYYNMELNLLWYGEELMCETAEFAIKVMRNLLDKRYN